MEEQFQNSGNDEDAIWQSMEESRNLLSRMTKSMSQGQGPGACSSSSSGPVVQKDLRVIKLQKAIEEEGINWIYTGGTDAGKIFSRNKEYGGVRRLSRGESREAQITISTPEGVRAYRRSKAYVNIKINQINLLATNISYQDFTSYVCLGCEWAVNTERGLLPITGCALFHIRIGANQGSKDVS